MKTTEGGSNKEKWKETRTTAQNRGETKIGGWTKIGKRWGHSKKKKRRPYDAENSGDCSARKRLGGKIRNALTFLT